MTRRFVFQVTGLIIVLLLTSPFFFDIYRIGVFNMVPHDNYADYVLYLAGQNPQAPVAPDLYRIGSVAVAMPFYYWAPSYTFTNLTNFSASYVKATEALSLVSYLSLVLTALVTFGIARRRFSASPGTAALLALAAFFLGGYTSIVGIDLVAILLISVLLYFEDDPRVFATLVVISAAFNEKIPIVFAAVLLTRAAFALARRQPIRGIVQLVSSCAATAAYFVVRLFLLRAPGWENQTTPSTYLHGTLDTLALTFTEKGLVANVLPLAIVVLLAVIAIVARRDGCFEVADVSAVVILLVMALFADLGVTLGRIVMYAFPFYLPAIAPFLDEQLGRLAHTL